MPSRRKSQLFRQENPKTRCFLNNHTLGLVTIILIRVYCKIHNNWCAMQKYRLLLISLQTNMLMVMYLGALWGHAGHTQSIHYGFLPRTSQNCSAIKVAWMKYWCHSSCNMLFSRHVVSWICVHFAYARAQFIYWTLTLDMKTRQWNVNFQM